MSSQTTYLCLNITVFFKVSRVNLNLELKQLFDMGFEIFFFFFIAKLDTYF